MTAKLLTTATKVVLSGCLAVIVGALSVLTVVPRAVHGAALTVLTGSMTPTIPVGSVVVVRPVDPGTLHVGDVVTFQRKPGSAELVTHRITTIHTQTTPVTLTTKGDANRGPDTDPVPVTAVRGKVLFHVPQLGTFRNAIGTGTFGLLTVVLGLLGYALSQLASALRERRRTAPRVACSARSATPTLSLQLLVARLPVAAFGGLLPHHAAHLLRMDLLDESNETFTLAVSREPDQLDELSQFLLAFDPLDVVRSEVLSVPLCVEVSQPEPSVPRLVIHRAA